jgi:tetratricopeptide (TPR) repeat protein
VFLIALAVLAAYHHTLDAPFHMDDFLSIVENPTIRSLGASWFPPRASGATVSGRPLLNVSLALNYRLSGTDVWSYHAFNLLIHILAGCLLFGVVHQTLRLLALAVRFGTDSWWLALSVALLWVLHPLQTESVTYVVQRAESLAGLFFLLTFHAFIRSTTSRRRMAWSAAAFASSLAGMATKEVMSTAPILLLLYDRVFLTGSWRDTWRLRWRQHAAFASTWLLLAALVAASNWRGGTVGAGWATSAEYALAQTYAIVTYLQLAVVPANLTFDYGVLRGITFRQIAPQFLAFLLLVAAAGVAMLRAPKAGYCCLFFFGVLAPTSSVVPVVTQTMAEHRMYLPLAAVAALVVMAAYLWLGRRARWLLAGLALALGVASYQRNVVYQSSLGLWQDAAAKRPGNPRAHYTIGLFHQADGRLGDAETAYRHALSLDPAQANAATNLSQLLRQLGRTDEAEATLTRALDHVHGPDRAVVLNNLADFLLLRPGREAEALARLQEAVRLGPDLILAHYNLAKLLARAKRPREAIPHFEAAIAARRDDIDFRQDYAYALMDSGDVARAVTEFQALVRLRPDSVDVLNNLGVALAAGERHAEAKASFERALAIDPDHQQVRENLARVERVLHD